MRAVILSAGRAYRLGSLAPRGCKVLAEVNGRTVLDRQLELLDGLVDEVTVVCRGAHPDLLENYPVRVVVTDRCDGPVGALRSAEPEGDTLIVYGDTLWERLPDAPEWIGVARTSGGRRWDLVTVRGIRYQFLEEDQTALVCVGLYRVLHGEEIDGPTMGEALSAYWPMPLLPVVGWQDVGDRESVASFREPIGVP